MAIRLTIHTQQRMQERQIAFSWIEAAISNPDWHTADPDASLTRSYKAIAPQGNRILRVVHRADGADILVVTAHFDRSAKR